MSRDSLFGALAVLVALALRLLRLLELRGDILWNRLIGDAAVHRELAAEIATRDFWGHEPFYRAPLYPYFLAALQRLFGPGLLAPRLVQILLGSLACLLAYRIARRLARPAIALAAALAGGAFWVLIQYDVELEIGTLPLFLNLLGLWLLLRAWPVLPDHAPRAPAREQAVRSALRDTVLAGIVFGLSAIARPDVLAFVLFAAIWFWMTASRAGSEPAGATASTRKQGEPSKGPAWRRQLPHGRRLAVALVAGALVPVAIVTARNLAVSGEFVPIASQGGVNFYIGNHAGSDGRTWMQPATISRREYREQERRAGDSVWARDNIWLVSRYAAEKARGRALGASEVSSYWLGQGLRFALRSPGQFLALLARKIYYLLNRWELHSGLDLYALARSQSNVLRALAWFDWGVLLPLALAGIAVSLRRSGPSLLLALYLLAYAAAIVLFFVNSRFRLPMVPVLAIFAALGIARLREAFAPGGRTLVLRYGAVLLIAAIVANTSWARVRNPFASVPVHNQLGDLYASAGRYPEAIAEYNTALRYAPGYAETHNCLAVVEMAMNRLDEAERSLSRALELDPGYALARANLGVLREKQGRGPEALAEYERALAIDSTMDVALLALSRGYAEAGDYARARDTLVRLVALDPGNARLHHNLGIAHVHLNDRENALREFREAARLDPALSAPHVRLGGLYEQSGDDAQAFAAYEEALRREPALSAALLGRARILLRSGDSARARADVEAVLRTSPNDAEARALLERFREAPLTPSRSSALDSAPRATR